MAIQRAYSLCYAAELEDASACHKHVYTEQIPVLGDDHQGVPVDSACGQCSEVAKLPTSRKHNIVQEDYNIC